MQLQALSPAIHTESSDKTRLEIEHLDSLMCEYRELTERPGTAHQLGPDALALAKSLGLPPVLTYEALILMNPLDTAPRTFLTDEVGRRDEIAFYRIHFEIERMLYPSIRMLIDTLSHVRPNSESFAPIGQALNESLQETKRKMGEMFRTLGVDSFARMRPYFMADPGRTDAEGRTYPGPSGASSAAFPTIDLLLGISSNESPDKDAIRPISP
ncbi:MAG TPA: DUF1864 family protein [bacterium]|nr:DUF1864 family protein [bacterium]